MASRGRRGGQTMKYIPMIPSFLPIFAYPLAPQSFVVIQPPPAKSNHSLNLQVQLVPPQSRDRDRRCSMDTCTTVLLGPRGSRPRPHILINRRRLESILPTISPCRVVHHLVPQYDHLTQRVVSGHRRHRRKISEAWAGRMCVAAAP